VVVQVVGEGEHWPLPSRDVEEVGALRKVSTVCARDCYDSCALIVTLDDSGRIRGIKGDGRNPYTQGFTCPRGARDHLRLHESRVESPCVRHGGRLQQTDWDTALNKVSKRLSETLDQHGAKAVLFLDYAGNTGLLSQAFPSRLWNALGATQTDWGLCSASGHAGLELHYGSSYGLEPMELLSRKLIVFWGFNAAVSSPHLWSLARKARRTRGAQIVAVDPRESQTAGDADLWVQPWPGSDVALAYAVMNHLIENNYVDLSFVRGWTQGFEQLKEEAGRWSPDRVADITGVGWNRIEQLGEAYGKLRPGATMIGIGLQKNERGADLVRAVSFLPALLGLHRGFFYSNAQGLFIDEDRICGRSLTEEAPPLVKQVAVADLVQSGAFKFIYVSGMNPALTLPNQRAFREGLSKTGVFMAVHDSHWTKTAQYADVILPAPTYLEKEDLVIPWSHRYLQYSRQVVPPVADSRSEIWVMREVSRRLGLTEEWLFEDPWVAVEGALEDAFEEGNIQSLRSGAMVQLKRKPRDSYTTPSGRIEFYSSQAPGRGQNALPTQAPLRSPEGDFVLLTSATPRYTSTQFQEVYGPIPALVLINRGDAKRLSIEERDVVSVSNDRGEVKMTAVVSGSVREGVAWSPRQSEGLEGEPQNCLMSSEPQELGGGPRFNSTTVAISKV
jgi:anaerobic selenocysteine-containing dehydrogenase